jgi:transcriptional regulator with GAF, ATPase, and Fis domain
MSQVDTKRPPATGSYELLIYRHHQSEVVPLRPGKSVVIGRGADSDICIEDGLISRRHAELHVAEGVEIEDLSSANGTVLVRNVADDGESDTSHSTALAPRERVRLHAGDVIKLGTAVIALKFRAKLASLPPGATSTSGTIRLDAEMLRTYELVKRAAATEISVLILGDTGVGKEVMAESIHRHSPRKDRTFLRLNCAALSDTLLESELFGHERGAFTGAHAAKEGLLESANGGSVFLDEVGELPLGTQAKLLRVLEERTVIRVGATKPRRIDVRFICATNRDLGQRISLGSFRSDLYYRISGLAVWIPPLRERQGEIEPLAQYFFRKIAARYKQPNMHLTPAATQKLRSYAWPGNVRELKNVIERAALLASAGLVDAEHIMLEPVGPVSTRNRPPPSPQLTMPPHDGTPESERSRIVHALEQCAGNQTQAARMLGLSRRTLINRLETFDLPRPRKSKEPRSNG